MAALLTDDERSRWRSFREVDDRDRFLAAHVLARVAVAGASGSAITDVELQQRCRRCGGPHGRPVATVGGRPGPNISFSHAGSVVVAAVAAVPVGVDVEPRRQPGAALDAIAVLLPGTPRSDLLARWVAVEAASKASGTGLEVRPEEVSFRGIRLVDLDLTAGYVGAVAVSTRRNPAVDVARVRWPVVRAALGASAPTATVRTGR